MDSLKGRRITVTGGNGFLGKFLISRLKMEGASDIFVPRKQDYDLRNREEVACVYADTCPQVLIHLAGAVGGIKANSQNPGAFFYENMAMGLHIVEEARRYGQLEKLVLVGTTCSYPKFTPVPFREEDLWNGYPEETNAPYGIAKRALLVMAQGYRKQYGLNAVYVIPANLYGPGDNFDLETSHVIPALIRKFAEAKESGSQHVDVWGTGNVSREFLYVEDAAEGIALAALRYEKPDPVNLGTGSEILIRDLVHEIRDLLGYAGEVRWRTSEPDGQPRRRLDVSKAEQEFGFRARTSLRAGLMKTIASYQEARQELATTASAGTGSVDGGAARRGSCDQARSSPAKFSGFPR
jgi:GDP-L-fucose synthase